MHIGYSVLHSYSIHSLCLHLSPSPPLSLPKPLSGSVRFTVAVRPTGGLAGATGRERDPRQRVICKQSAPARIPLPLAVAPFLFADARTQPAEAEQQRGQQRQRTDVKIFNDVSAAVHTPPRCCHHFRVQRTPTHTHTHILKIRFPPRPPDASAAPPPLSTLSIRMRACPPADVCITYRAIP